METGYFEVMGVLALLYLIPTWIAFLRRHPNRWLIFAGNVFLGETGIIWFLCLIWALKSIHRSPTGNHGGESGLNLTANDPIVIRHDEPQKEPDDFDRAVDGLARLRRLHEAGELSAEEYAELRKPFLERLAGV